MRTRMYVGAVTAAFLAVSAFVSGAQASMADGTATAPTHRSSVEDPYYPGKSNPEIDTLHNDLALKWDGTVLTGTATIRFQTTRDTNTVRLDLIHSLEVSKVTLDGAAVGYTHKQYGLVIKVGNLVKGEEHTFVITYSGVPHTVHAPTHRGDFGEGLGWTLDDDGNVYTFQEPYGAYSWFPVNDHPSDKANYDAEITVPSEDTAVFIGSYVGADSNGDGTTTYRWHGGRPVSSYLVTIAIGPYKAYHATVNGTRITYWLLPRDDSILASLKAQTADAFKWLEKHAGNYPFRTFGIVVTGGASAMETQTLVTLSRAAFDRPDAVIEHEMAHEWYGDAISPVDWQGMWLNEGWAMWMQQAYEVYRGGYKYLGGIDNWWQYDENSRQESGPPGDYDPKSFGDLNVYLGPAMMLDKIRQRVGNAEFTELSVRWVSEHAYGNVTRAEFLKWLNDTTGKRFDKLVNLWLDSKHTPDWP